MHPTRELLVLVAGLITAGAVTFLVVLPLVDAWWRRHDRLAEQRYTRRSR